VGSVKSNLGHTEAAAGVAGLVKAVLSVERAYVPAHLHFGKLNPAIDGEAMAAAGVEVCRQGRAWSGARRVAGVSSFGFSGTNAHVVLEAAEAAAAREGAAAQLPLLVLSASSEAQLAALKTAVAEYLGQAGVELARVVASCARRTLFAHRCVAVAESVAEAQAQLRGAGLGESAPRRHVKARAGSAAGGDAVLAVPPTTSGSSWLPATLGQNRCRASGISGTWLSTLAWASAPSATSKPACTSSPSTSAASRRASATT